MCFLAHFFRLCSPDSRRVELAHCPSTSRCPYFPSQLASLPILSPLPRSHSYEDWPTCNFPQDDVYQASSKDFAALYRVWIGSSWSLFDGMVFVEYTRSRIFVQTHTRFESPFASYLPFRLSVGLLLSRLNASHGGLLLSRQQPKIQKKRATAREYHVCAVRVRRGRKCQIVV